jgi:hypothetical protein
MAVRTGSPRYRWVGAPARNPWWVGVDLWDLDEPSRSHRQGLPGWDEGSSQATLDPNRDPDAPGGIAGINYYFIILYSLINFFCRLKIFNYTHEWRWFHER